MVGLHPPGYVGLHFRNMLNPLNGFSVDIPLVIFVIPSMGSFSLFENSFPSSKLGSFGFARADQVLV